ncbi:unnamed protein product [Boreogadus saida]
MRPGVGAVLHPPRKVRGPAPGTEHDKWVTSRSRGPDTPVGASSGKEIGPDARRAGALRPATRPRGGFSLLNASSSQAQPEGNVVVVVGPGEVPQPASQSDRPFDS